MAWEENSCICLNMQLIAILSRIGVYSSHLPVALVYPPQILSVYLSRARCLFPSEQFWRRSLSQDKIRLSIQFSRHRIRKPVCLLHRIRSRIYRNNRSRRPLSFLTYEAATASVNTLMRTPSTSLSASAQAVVVAPVVNTSSIISTCFLAKASARRRQKIPSTFSHRS